MNPFSCSYTPQVPDILNELNCTLAVSTYQAGKIIFLSADDGKLVQLTRSFDRAMGMALRNNQLAVACREEVIVLSNSSQLAAHYPKQPNTYDALYLPRATYYTGQIDLHDLDYTADGLCAVNTSFSCIIKIDDEFTFTPVWQPSFITELASEDRCHLNGMAVQEGRIKYATAFNQGNSMKSWRNKITSSGVLIDISDNHVINDHLPMPHSPRIYNDRLYVLLSATGEIAEMDISTGKYNVIRKLDGFVRGMAHHGDYLFVGLSRLRKSSSVFGDLEIALKAEQAGIAIIHLQTGALAGEIRYLNSVEEIYDVQVLPGIKRPGILNTGRAEFRLGIHTPGQTYWGRPAENKNE